MIVEVGTLLLIDVQDCVFCEVEYCLRGPFHVLKRIDVGNIIKDIGIPDPNGEDVVAWLLKMGYIKQADCEIIRPI